MTNAAKLASLGSPMTADSSGNVGIGTASPSAPLTVFAARYDTIRVGRSAAASFAIGIPLGSSTDSLEFNGVQAGYDGYLFTGTSGIKMRIDSPGRVTTPNQPYFYAYATANFSSGQNEFMPYNTTLYNTGSYYNTSTYRFTAPVAGVYIFFHRLSTQAGVSYEAKLILNGSTELSRNYMPALSTNTQNASVVIYLSAGDYVSAGIYVGSSQTWLGTVQQQSAFYGYLLG